MTVLSKRLQAIHDLVPFSVTADIGSDHGKLMIALFENNKIPSGYAVENKKGPFEKLKSSIEASKAKDYVIPLYSDGLNNLPIDVNTLVLAGLGGQTIIDILFRDDNKLKNIETIITDAHSCNPELRNILSIKGFIIEKEIILKENVVFYEIIRFRRFKSVKYNDLELKYGPILLKEKSQVFKEKYEKQLESINKLLKLKLPKERLNELKKEKEEITKIL